MPLNRPLTLRYLLLGILLSIAANTYAIGDSGGCGDPLAGSLGEALRSGTPEQLENTIRKWVALKEEHLSTKEKLAFLFNGGNDARARWRAKQIENIIEGVHEKNASCVPGPLFPIAVHAGNIAVVRFLLSEPMGVSPTISTDFLFACETSQTMKDEERQRRLKAYEFVLDAKKIDLHEERYAIAALWACKEPDLLTLFLKRGAKPNVLDSRRGGQVFLENAVLDAVGYEEGGYIARKLHGIERARIFSELGLTTIAGSPVEMEVRRKCNHVINGKRWNENTCKTLATFVNASHGTFGDD